MAGLDPAIEDRKPGGWSVGLLYLLVAGANQIECRRR